MNWSSRNDTAKQPPGPLVCQQRLGVNELRHESKDQTDLIDHACRFDGVDHPLHRRRIERQGLLAEHGDASLGRGGHEVFVFRRPRRDEHGIDPFEQFVLVDHLGADAIGERLRPFDVDVVHGDDPVIGRRVLEEPVVGPSDEPRPDEPDPNRHPRSVTSGVRPAM